MGTVSNGTVVGYVGPRIPGWEPCRRLQDWHGNVIGSCQMTISWRANSYVGTRLYQMYAKIGERYYTGRGFGEGMSVRLFPVARDNEVHRRLRWPASRSTPTASS